MYGCCHVQLANVMRTDIYIHRVIVSMAMWSFDFWPKSAMEILATGKDVRVVAVNDR